MTVNSKQSESGAATGDGALNVLISGASFAGLAAAFWMLKLGYAVTMVEIAPQLRKGGTPVDIREGVVEVARRMGLLEKIAGKRLPPRAMEFLDGNGRRVAGMTERGGDRPDSPEGYEIERDDLLDMLFDEVKDKAEVMFGESIASLEQTAERVDVRFASGGRRSFSLVLGCDGTHSAVRRMCFGEERQFSVFLENYFALVIVPKLLLAEDTSQMFNVPGKAVMLSAYNGKTDIAFCFSSSKEIAYGRRDREEQERMIRKEFQGEGWRLRELLEEMSGCDNFYFDKLVQIRMPAWSTGRVALVGDAAYCPSPAAGMGGSTALLGAAALADALREHPDDVRRAFEAYDKALRPIMEQIQTEAVEVGLEMFMPRTDEAIERRNLQLNGA